ncbi:DHH family phosphoesterase [Halococcus thailandensis]|nr:bifunctional oligoribonuclease/PAP phosphatase NrnA [Halococcus thailandensis]
MTGETGDTGAMNQSLRGNGSGRVDNDAVDVATRADALLDILHANQSLAIICHNNPDPDCLASALALDHIAEEAGVEHVDIYHGGEITHQQNRAMVNLLDIPTEPYADATPSESDLLAFVDHGVPGRNNEVSAETPIDIVIDHHPADDVDAQYLDHQPDSGATATIMVEYLRALDLALDEQLATALLFGIRRETLGFMRGVTEAEYAAAQYLHAEADKDTLRTLADSLFTGITLDAIGQAVLNRRVRGSCLVASAGRTSERDALPQAADYLLNLEGVSTTVVFGFIDDSIHLSARTRNTHVHIGEVIEEAFDDDGSAGGHREMAGGVVPLGPFTPSEADETVEGIVSEAVYSRAFDALQEWC